MVIVFLLLLVLLPAPCAGRNALVPRPQKIQYGSGAFPLRTPTIRLTPAPGDEDRFAAQELSSCLSARVGPAIEIVEAPGPGRQAISLSRTGAVDALPMPDERPGPDSREAYSIKVTRQGTEVRARSSAGVFYGVQTLCQLAEGQGDSATLPEVEIQDWPVLAYRGTMMDMSHGGLLTEEEVKRHLDFLARWKANQYYFYSEASIELEGYPLLNPEGRFTKDQVRRIIAYGRERHVDVIPNLELYGHLHDLFRIERYSDLAALPHGGEFNPGNPKVMALLADWVDQLSRLFPSAFVHIGFDETWQIEMAAKQQGAGATPARLFVEQLKNVARLFEQRGKRVLAWGDIMVKYPEIISEMPPGLIAVAWYYDPEPDPTYRKWLEPLAARRRPHMIQTGVASWEEIAPNFAKTFANIDTFLAAGRRSNALGIINSVWTDDATVLLRMSLPGMAYGAAAAWQTEPMEPARFFAEYARLMYSAAVAPEVATALERLNAAELDLQKVLREGTMFELWRDPFTAATLKLAGEHREDLRQTRLAAEEAQERLYRALAQGGGRATLDSLLFGSRLLDYAGLKFLNAVEIADRWRELGPHPTTDQWWNGFESEVAYQSHGRLADMMDAITELREVYRSAWLAEYTPYRLSSALGRFDAEYEYWRGLQERFRNFSRTRKDGEALPPLESVILPR